MGQLKRSGVGRHTLVMVLGLGVAASWAPLARAQQGGEAVAIEEIVVTAQKREESLQDVPISVSAYSGEFLERARIEDVKDLIDLTPGVAGRTKDSYIDYVSVRGIITNDFGIGGDPSVGIYKDGVYQGRNGVVMTSFYDLDRVEVLKGPQGLLFGRNAASGAMSVITAKPNTDDLEGYVRAGAGERSHYELEGAVNIPLSDSWAVRFAGYHAEEDGYTKNVVGGNDLVDFDRTAGRAMLGYEGDRLSGFFMAEYEDRDQSATIYRATELDDFGVDEEDVASDLLDNDKDESQILSLTLELNYDFDFARLTSISAYRDHDFDYLEDFDGTPLTINTYSQDQDGDYWSQEFKLVSTGVGPLQWLVGASYYNEDIQADFYQQSDEDTQCIYWLGDTCDVSYEPVYEEPWPGYTPGGLIESNTAEGNYDGWAVYGELSYDITDRLAASAGLRYTYDEKEFSNDIDFPTSALGPFYVFGLWTDGPVQDKKDWDEWTPRFALTYDIADEVRLYGTAVKGFKSGGFGTFNVLLPEGTDFVPYETFDPAPEGTKPDPFDPETVWSYEVGMKSRWLDDRLQANVSAFYYKYDDLQITFFNGETNNTEVENVGSAEGTGFEADLRFLPNAYLDFYAGISYLDTEIDDIPADVCEDCDGNELIVAPEWTFAGIGTFRYPVGRFGDAFFTAEYTWQDDFYSDFDNSSAIQVDSYGLTNFRLGLEETTGKWVATLYLENAFDEFYWDGAGAAEEIIPDHFFGPGRPRTFGGELLFRF
jgi:iron complex outermembrane receptor protein